jgi:putative hydrolase of the HAD superfamily
VSHPPGAVFFDVDFTLIHPGPTFRGEGYARFCERYGIAVDSSRFDEAVSAASAVLDDARDHTYDDALFHRYTAEIIRGMGGEGDSIAECAREMYREWGACHHFELYDDVPGVLRTLAQSGIRIGLISNSHRCLASFQSHFELHGLITAALSSSEHGFLKPHPSIFEAALRLIDVPAAEAVMVGDSLTHDILGALRVGMGGILVDRRGNAAGEQLLVGMREVPVVRSLADVPPLLGLEAARLSPAATRAAVLQEREDGCGKRSDPLRGGS